MDRVSTYVHMRQDPPSLYEPVHILDDPPSIPTVMYVLNGWAISQTKKRRIEYGL